MKIPLHIPRYRSCQTDRGRVFSRRYVRTGDISAELSTAAPSPRAVFEIGHRTEYWMSRIGDGFARHGEGKVEATISRLNVRLNKLRKCSLLVVLDDTIKEAWPPARHGAIIDVRSSHSKHDYSAPTKSTNCRGNSKRRFVWLFSSQISEIQGEKIITNCAQLPSPRRYAISYHSIHPQSSFDNLFAIATFQLHPLPNMYQETNMPIYMLVLNTYIRISELYAYAAGRY